MFRIALAIAASIFASASFAQTTQPTAPGETQVPLVFSGGHDTDPRDGGRPVVLVASGLGVPPDLFRNVFKGVHPARGAGGPSGDQARANKKVLLDGLSKYGVTNDRLDEVSNRYRYRPQDGELWTHKEAEGYATVRDGKVISATITEPGYGYSSEPTVTVPNHPEATIKTTLAFTQDLDTNGSIASATLAK